jgi:hypothetical protein
MTELLNRIEEKLKKEKPVSERPESVLDKVSKKYGLEVTPLDVTQDDTLGEVNEGEQGYEAQNMSFLPISRRTGDDGNVETYFNLDAGFTGSVQKVMDKASSMMEFIKTNGEKGLDPRSKLGVDAAAEVAALFATKSVASRANVTAAKSIVPTTKEILKTANQQYKQAKNMGAGYSYRSIKELIAKIKNTEFTDDLPINKMTALTQTLKKLGKQPKGQNPSVPLSTLIRLRRDASGYGKNKNKNVQRGSVKITKLIDEFIQADAGNVTFPNLASGKPVPGKFVTPFMQGNNVRPASTGGQLPPMRVADPKRHAEMVKLFKDGNENYAAGQSSKTLEAIPLQAERMGGVTGKTDLDTAQRVAVTKAFPSSADLSKISGRTANEVGQINRIVEGNKTRNAIRLAGNTLNSMQGRAVQMGLGAAGLMSGVPAAGIMAAAAGGPILSSVAKGETKRQIRNLAKNIRRESALGKENIANDTALKKLGRGADFAQRKFPQLTLAKALMANEIERKNNALPPNQTNMSRGFGGARVSKQSLGSLFNPPIEELIGFDPNKFY